MTTPLVLIFLCVFFFKYQWCTRTSGCKWMFHRTNMEDGGTYVFLPGPCHSLARCFPTTGRRTDKGLWEQPFFNTNNVNIYKKKNICNNSTWKVQTSTTNPKELIRFHWWFTRTNLLTKSVKYSLVKCIIKKHKKKQLNDLITKLFFFHLTFLLLQYSV